MASLDPQGMLSLELGKTMGIVSGLISSVNIGGPGENAITLSKLSIEKRSEEIIHAIQQHFPFINQVTSETTAPGLGTVYADLPGLPRKIPLSLISGGISRLFTMMLNIVQCEKGVILLDEIENGIFYEQYPLVWRTLFDLAKKHETQLFISTHSKECLKEVAAIIASNPDDFCLLKVRQEGDQSIVNYFDGTQFAAALEKDGEIRD